jgi:hypothetical protein
MPAPVENQTPAFQLETILFNDRILPISNMSQCFRYFFPVQNATSEHNAKRPICIDMRLRFTWFPSVPPGESWNSPVIFASATSIHVSHNC